MQVAKRRIKDKKFNSEVSEIKREKQETEEYHKQLVKRIKEEKEEKKRKREQQVSPPTSPLLPSQTPSLSPSKNYTTAMIRVRLLDGTTISKEFQAMDTLQTVKNTLTKHANIPGSITSRQIFQTTYLPPPNIHLHYNNYTLYPMLL